MAYQTYDEGSAAEIEFTVVRQFARLLRIQAGMLERDGDFQEAAALRRRAARSERAVFFC